MNILPEHMIDAISGVESSLAREVGDFSLFGLFLRVDSPAVWDLVVAAPWIDGSANACIRLIATTVRDVLPPHEMLYLSGVTALGQESRWHGTIHDEVELEHEPTYFADRWFFGRRMLGAYIFTCKKREGGVTDGS